MARENDVAQNPAAQAPGAAAEGARGRVKVGYKVDVVHSGPRGEHPRDYFVIESDEDAAEADGVLDKEFILEAEAYDEETETSFKLLWEPGGRELYVLISDPDRSTLYKCVEVE